MLIWLLSCGETPKEIDTDTTVVDPTYVDADGDGYTEEDDCDDTNVLVNPTAEEICDGIDNDCDQEIDEEVGDVYYTDSDLDGYGDPERIQYFCETPSEFDAVVLNSDDCDDSNPDSNPDADEICDDLDNNCNLFIDEDLNYDWYYDNDGDGFGTAVGYVYDCDPGQGYVANAEDCDDEDASISPLSNEICDGLDNDCNGSVDDGVGEIWYIDGDNDGVGDIAGFVYSCEQPNGYAASSGDCDDINSLTYPNAPEYCDGEDNDCDGSVDESGAVNEVDWYQDSDADGFGDLSVVQSACEQPSGYVLNNTDCTDLYASVYPAAPELCDGLINDCTNPLIDPSESDLDGDGFVECSIDSNGWQGHTSVIGGDDCDDTNAFISPSALEICDGIVNICGDSLSGDETDDDGDGYVECPIDVSGWAGNTTIIGGGDCDDTQATVSPEGVELCDGLANLCSTIPSYEIDNDGDGYVECTIDAGGWFGGGTVIGGGDCDDTDDLLSPGDPEVCDGLDNDCDGQIDEALLNTYYYDGDFDGFGNPFATVQSCTQPSGYVGNANDCNDGNSSVYIGASETCDGFDNDCDGQIDENLQTTFFLDNDVDGYGNPNIQTQSCTAPSGYVSNSEDCNDSNANATYIGSDSSCSRTSCLDIHTENSSLGTGAYWIQPNTGNAFQTTCDMSTDGGGWTEISFQDAQTYLNGAMTKVVAAKTSGIDASTGPYTRDGSGYHTHYYTFTFSSGFSQFRLVNYEVRANAANGATSDLNSNSFVVSSWSQAYSGCHGDVGWGAASVGPQLSLASIEGQASCKDCFFFTPNETHTVGQNATKFRIVWGERCGESEGWKPWYSGSVYLR